MAERKRINGMCTVQAGWHPQKSGSYVQIGCPFRLGRKWFAVFECACGNVRAVVVRGNDRTFLCRKCTPSIANGKIHNPTYKSWNSMKERCNPNTIVKSYQWYRANAIKVCDRWSVFQNFIDDMGLRPNATTLDRIDTYGHYSCGKCDDCKANNWSLNCRWATHQQQCRNKRDNHKITCWGETKSVTEWAEDARVTVCRQTIFTRIRQGWDIYEALTVPSQRERNHV